MLRERLCMIRFEAGDMATHHTVCYHAQTTIRILQRELISIAVFVLRLVDR